MSSMLADVVSSGTGSRARASGFSLPAAGKTGTTDDYADAWFIGYTPHLLTGVWFGLDKPAPIMREGFGGVVAVPAWAAFMRAATKGLKAEWYKMPAGVEKVAICRLSGMRAGPACRDAHIQARAAYEGEAQSVVAIPAGVDGKYPPEPTVGPLPRPEPTVYEDLFPVGAIPSETCTAHDPAGQPVGTTGGATPIVDALLREQLSASPPPVAAGAAIRRPATRLFVERIPQSDGTIKYVVRERQ